MWEVLSARDYDVPLIFGGDWNFENSEEMALEEWKEWAVKHDIIDMSDVAGCESMNNPTWTNRHYQGNFLAKRLDRVYFLEQGSWISHEIEGKLLYRHTVSDHTPIWIRFKCKMKITVDKAPLPLSSMYLF